MSDRIVRYYLLCTVRAGGKMHIVDELPERNIALVFTKKEIDLFLRKHDGHYIAREIVVGGSEEPSQTSDRQPIVVI